MISKKKVFTKIETDFQAKIGKSNAFSGRITISTSQLRHPISFGGLFSFFHQKSASKAPKTCDFAYFTGQWGGSSPPAPPPGYAADYNFYINRNYIYVFLLPFLHFNQQITLTSIQSFSNIDPILCLLYTVAAKLKQDSIHFDNQSKKLHFYHANRLYFDVALK